MQNIIPHITKWGERHSDIHYMVQIDLQKHLKDNEYDLYQFLLGSTAPKTLTMKPDWLKSFGLVKKHHQADYGNFCMVQATYYNNLKLKFVLVDCTAQIHQNIKIPEDDVNRRLLLHKQMI